MKEETYIKTEAKIYSFKNWIENIDPDFLKVKYKEALEQAGFTILQFSEHYFPIQGYTCFWLLGESHLAIHTFPEEGKSYIELSSCNEYKLEKFKKFLEA